MERSEIIGALGPTNTGKTHRAIERMLEHDSGMIGLPLRLLAREVYDKVEKRVGNDAVALITGEEKRVPPRPDYWICTVEAMPMNRDVDFLAVDEIQLAGHRDRGHVFTDRLLHARGRKETWFMGSDTMTNLIRQLVPTIQLRSFPRLSSLSTEGSFTLGSLPRRSAVVAFSAKRVYELAEKLRARKGGAAIVFGGLSPRARNAQVAMYQAGEVDYLVATDAIGMGLNLDIDRVAFADTRKFDGREWREVELSELAQIAGRAGRHTKNGAFGTFARPPLPPEAERAIMNHRFPQQRRLVWRRSDLDFSSPGQLLETLEEHPRKRALELVVDPEDTATLKKLLSRGEIRQRVKSETDLRLLWDLCQIPDYRQLLVDEHAYLVGEIFEKILTHGRVPADDVHARLDRLARHTGDIDMITSRISFTRTWNYVANHENWLENAPELAARTRQLEDSLSDDLNQALMERFVARRRTHYTKQRSETAASKKTNTGSPFDQLSALHAEMVRQPSSEEQVAEALGAPLDSLTLSSSGHIQWEALSLGQLLPGRTLLEPNVKVASMISGTPLSDPALHRVKQFVDAKLREALGPLAPGNLDDSKSTLRGLAYQLKASFGLAPSRQLTPLVKELTPEERKSLENSGFVFGVRHTYCAPLLKPPAVALRRPFLRAYYLPKGDPTLTALAQFDSPLTQESLTGRPSLPSGPVSEEIWMALGYAQIGQLAIRADILEVLLQNRHLSGDAWEQFVANRTGQKLNVARRLAARIAGQKKKRRRRGRSQKQL